MKEITVHGPATHHDLIAWKFSGEDSRVLAHAGFGETQSYIMIVKCGPTCFLYVDTFGGYAPSATESGDYVLNTAVQEILHNWGALPPQCHIEVGKDEIPNSQFHSFAVSEGLKFK
jgi:hypothetical protein